MVLEAKTIDRNGISYGYCPNCGRMYALADKNGPIEMPARCRRCNSPTDPGAALRFANEAAERTHNPSLHAMGERMRGMTAPGMDKMVSSPAAKK